MAWVWAELRAVPRNKIDAAIFYGLISEVFFFFLYLNFNFISIFIYEFLLISVCELLSISI